MERVNGYQMGSQEGKGGKKVVYWGWGGRDGEIEWLPNRESGGKGRKESGVLGMGGGGMGRVNGYQMGSKKGKGGKRVVYWGSGE